MVIKSIGEKEKKKRGLGSWELFNTVSKEIMCPKIKKKMKMERKEKELRRKDILNKFSAVKHACKALEYINKRTKFLVSYYREHRVSVYTTKQI